jgi:hypothetical protein
VLALLSSCKCASFFSSIKLEEEKIAIYFLGLGKSQPLEKAALLSTFIYQLTNA